ncbi:MAG TPA: DUF4157 domain-containing protein, partial [Acidimicrobiales bacterium]|nr:DUF4157 domain-containing protein [Acidimicrobiales bacterium]
MTDGPAAKPSAPAKGAEPSSGEPGRKVPGAITTSRDLARGRAAAQAAATARGVASALGLPSEQYRVRSDDDARAVVDRHRARGVAIGDTVHIHPEDVRPEGWATRALLAHELAHVVQTRNGRLGPPPVPADVPVAEAEAEELAEAVRAGRALWRPTGRLPPGHTARDRDVATPPTTTTPTTSSGVDEADAPKDEGGLIAAFRDLARANHKAEIDLANDQLTTLLGIGDSDVEAVLHTLDALPFPIARAVVQNMTPGLRLRAAK